MAAFSLVLNTALVNFTYIQSLAGAQDTINMTGCNAIIHPGGQGTF
jgi:hypothetical protein